jgi:hypothetical protein
MKSKFISTISLLLLLFNLNDASSAKEKNGVDSISYFPVYKGTTLIYESSFGDCTTKYFNDGEFTISSSEGDKFKYKQSLIIKEDGVYVKEIYRFLKIFLFIRKEETLTYGKLLLRFPLPLSPGMEWSCEAEEYKDGVTSKVKVTGKALNKEFVITQAGRFEAIKIESIIEGSSNSKNKVTEWYAEGIGLIKAKIIIEGGGLMGFLRDILGYGTIEFELKGIRKQS